MKRGRFIVLEGLDGCGKTTQAKLLSNELKKYNIDTYLTAEPTNSILGNIYRNILLGNIKIDEKALAPLILADRINHIESVINPMLDKGVTVISERYYLSSLAYNAQSTSSEWIRSMHDIDFIIKPDLTVFLDITPEDAVKHIGLSEKTKDAFETISKLKKARELYYSAIIMEKRQNAIFSILDVVEPVEYMTHMILKAVQRHHLFPNVDFKLNLEE